MRLHRVDAGRRRVKHVKVHGVAPTNVLRPHANELDVRKASGGTHAGYECMTAKQSRAVRVRPLEPNIARE